MNRDEASALFSTLPGRKSSYSGDTGDCVMVVGVAGVPYVGFYDSKASPDEAGQRATILVSERAFVALAGFLTK